MNRPEVQWWIDDYGLPRVGVALMKRMGIRTIRQLANLRDDQILGIPGIGQIFLDRTREVDDARNREIQQKNEEDVAQGQGGG